MSKSRYHPASIFLHWFVFLLIVAALITIELKGQFPKGSEARDLCKSIHGVFGQLIFLAMALRLILRFTYGVPKPTNPKPVFISLAQAMHWLMYALLLISTIFGILYFQYGGKEINFFFWKINRGFNKHPCINQLIHDGMNVLRKLTL